MDYRDTEDFARSMEAAALRSRYLRGQAAEEFWNAVGRVLRALWRRVARAVGSSALKEM